MAPEAAKLFCQAVKGKLTFAPREAPESINDFRAFSLVEALHIDVQGLRAPLRSVASDSNGGSSSSGDSFGWGRRDKTSPSGQRNDDSDPNGDRVPDDRPNRLTDPSSTKSPVGASAMRPLRCPYNACSPEYYCANDRTGRKYQPCAGPGWTKMQYIKQAFACLPDGYRT